ncbi:hypothetical protein [Kribbella sp. NPDC048928]|uniref:hypothetical protein n=1 Tax=Kribbella sp. NPDC048928 TaxID=3364111 RepID=UPI003717FE7A
MIASAAVVVAGWQVLRRVTRRTDGGSSSGGDLGPDPQVAGQLYVELRDQRPQQTGLRQPGDSDPLFAAHGPRIGARCSRITATASVGRIPPY